MRPRGSFHTVGVTGPSPVAPTIGHGWKIPPPHLPLPAVFLNVRAGMSFSPCAVTDGYEVRRARVVKYAPMKNFVYNCSWWWRLASEAW